MTLDECKKTLKNVMHDEHGYPEYANHHLSTIWAAGVTVGADEEAKRWCEELNFLHTEYGADCSGCDSGDPLDCVEVEIRQVIGKLESDNARLLDAIRRILDSPPLLSEIANEALSQSEI